MCSVTSFIFSSAFVRFGASGWLGSVRAINTNIYVTITGDVEFE
jgi:hypothetical protein